MKLSITCTYMDEKQRILIKDSQEWAWNNIFTAAKNTKDVRSASLIERIRY